MYPHFDWTCHVSVPDIPLLLLTRNYKINRSGGRPKNRGFKKLPGDYVEKGMILFTQLGMKIHPGAYVSFLCASIAELQRSKFRSMPRTRTLQSYIYNSDMFCL